MDYKINRYNNNINFYGSISERIRDKRQQSANTRLDNLIEKMARSSDSKIEPFGFNLKRSESIQLGLNRNSQHVESRLVPAYGFSDKYCIFFHGGTSTVSNYEEFIKWLNLEYTSVLAVEYPGYGNNRHIKPSFDNIEQTAKAAYDYLRKTLHCKPEQINILGYCFGAPVATNLAKSVDCNSVTLLSPITALTQLSGGYLKSKATPLTFADKVRNFLSLKLHKKPYKFDRLNTFSGIENVNCPIYVISSFEDPVTDIKYTDNFVKCATKKGKQVTYMQGIEMGHKLTKFKALFLSRLMFNEGKNIMPDLFKVIK